MYDVEQPGSTTGPSTIAGTASWGRRALALVIDWAASSLVTLTFVRYGSDAYSWVVLGSDAATRTMGRARAEDEDKDVDSLTSQLCFRPDGRYVASASWVKSVRLWKTSDAECVVEFREHGEDVWYVAFSPDGEFLSSGDWGASSPLRLHEALGLH